jgi:hypothetical protein
MKKQFIIGGILFITALLFGVAETIYFGCNLTPQTSAEATCDNIALAVSLFGILLIVTAKITRQ